MHDQVSNPTLALSECLNLETAVDRFKLQLSPCFLKDFIVNNAHRFGENAPRPIAHFSGSLDYVARPSNMEVASSSRLARKPEKRTLEPVQLPFLG